MTPRDRYRSPAPAGFACKFDPVGCFRYRCFSVKKYLEGQQPEATASWYLRRRRVTSTPSAKETGHARRICYQVTLDRRVCSHQQLRSTSKKAGVVA